MQSKASTVAAYMAEIPDDRKTAMKAVLDVIRKNVDKDIEEGILYGMIGFYIPHRVFPAGYHCDPKLPLGYIALASQKNYMSLYINWVYHGANEGGIPGPDGGDNQHLKWFRSAWAKSGKKLDMGKCCIRFKKLDDLPLDVIAEAIRRVPTKLALEFYEKTLEQSAANKSAKTGKAPAKGKASAGAATKPASKIKDKATKKVAKKAPKPAAKKSARK